MTTPGISCSGVAEIIRYNRGQYIAAGLVICALAVFLVGGIKFDFPGWLLAAPAVGMALAAWWTLASLLASWWIYDLSPLRRWDWLQKLAPGAGKCWVYVHTGLDECGYRFRAETDRARGVILDTYSPAVMTEPSIQIARAETAATRLPDARCRWDAWPVKPGSSQLCYFILAAHELRQRDQRKSLFSEAARGLAPGGQLILAEHARDAANFLAFGPGFMHFWSPSEWDTLAAETGFDCTHKGRIAGFIITRVYTKREE